MKNIIIYVIVGVVVIGGGIFFFSQSKSGEATPNAVNNKETSIATNAGPVLDSSLCTIQANKAYLCPAKALSNFGPASITDSGQHITCYVSYDSEKGFSYKGSKKNVEISAGEFVATLAENGAVANIARSHDSQNITLFMAGSNRIIHVLVSNINDYSSEQCLEL